jgi:glutamate formiminotransferase/formiminotetrahydrofolate cyclodeaminase
MKQIVECIPNFSEGRRPEIIAQIIEAAKSAGVLILDASSDADHNRTVLSFAGTPSQVEEAAFLAIKMAASLIDLDQHQGEHPRMGATDVVPFVPISGVSLAECVAIAKRLGARVGSELSIPVYLYEAAATRPERTNLENVRRGQYEGIKVEIETKPERFPDFGPAKMGSAGATVIGARTALVAFNVYLTTSDVTIAKQIAKAMRHSSGGFRYLKAAGFLVDGVAQVSMNLTDFTQTPIARVVETIRREAQRYGVGIHHSELVGLIPQDALVDAAVWYTQLDQFSKDQILEQRLGNTDEAPTEAAIAVDSNGEDFIQKLAATTPTPGGGSAGAYAGAMAAGLVSMVAGSTIGKKKYFEVEAEMNLTLGESESLRKELFAGVSEDSAAFDVVMNAYKLPKDSPETEAVREFEIEKATLNAAIIPLGAAKKAIRVMELAINMMLHGNVNAISDAASAVALGNAAVTSSALNVRINVNGLKDKTAGQALLVEISGIEQKARILIDAVQPILKDRAGF